MTFEKAIASLAYQLFSMGVEQGAARLILLHFAEDWGEQSGDAESLIDANMAYYDEVWSHNLRNLQPSMN